jgi:hypothetical protein
VKHSNNEQACQFPLISLCSRFCGWSNMYLQFEVVFRQEMCDLVLLIHGSSIIWLDSSSLTLPMPHAPIFAIWRESGMNSC